MSNRFHSKYHRSNHHTYGSAVGRDGTPTNPDAGHDPIASPDHPFKGDFCLRGGLSASVPTASAYAGAFMGNLLLTGDFVIFDNVINADLNTRSVGININPTLYQPFDLIVNDKLKVISNITTHSLSATTVGTDYLRVNLKTGSVNYPVNFVNYNNNYSYFALDKEGRVGVNLGQTPNFESNNFKVIGKTLFDVGATLFDVKGNTYINHNDFYVTKIGTNTNAGMTSLGRDEFVTLSELKVLRSDGNVVFSKNFYLSGNSVFGDSSTADTSTFTSRIASDFVPNTASRNLGSSSLPWSTLYFKIITGGDGTFSNNLFVSGNTLLGNTTDSEVRVFAKVASDLVPNNTARNLGTVTLPWNTLYFNTLSGYNGTFTNDLIVNRNLTVSGNTTIGNSTSDILNVNARVNTDITPYNTSKNLGTSLLPWNTLYLTDLRTSNGYISNDLQVNGDTTIGDSVSDSVTINSRINSDLIPIDGNRQLGNALTKWFNIYVENIISDKATFSSDVNIYGSSTLGDTSADTVYINSRIGTNLIPKDTSRQLGSNALPWDYVYLKTLNAIDGTFNGQILAPNQTAASGSSVLTKNLADSLYGSFIDNFLTSDSAANSTTTYSTIQTIALEANSTYLINSVTSCYTTTTGGSNLRFLYSGTTTRANITDRFSSSSSTTTYGRNFIGTTLPTNVSSIASTGPETHTYSRDTLITTSTAGNLSIQMALVAVAGSVTAKQGSFITARKIS